MQFFVKLVYNFQLFDGQITTRDLSLVLKTPQQVRVLTCGAQWSTLSITAFKSAWKMATLAQGNTLAVVYGSAHENGRLWSFLSNFE